MQTRRAALVLFVLLLARTWGAPPAALAQPIPAVARAETRREAAAARALERVRHSPPQLRMFLAAMPKGADLHNHADGAVYAERLLDWAVADGDCLDSLTSALSAAPCGPGQRPAAEALLEPAQREFALGALSMRGFSPAPTVPGSQTGHDHFFATFGKFRAVTAVHKADVLAETVRQAALDRVNYLEVMVTFSGAAAAAAAREVVFSEDFGALRADLFAHGYAEGVEQARRQLHELDAQRLRLLGCDRAGSQPAACGVTVRYLMQVVRVLPPAAVFAQTLLGYELARTEPRVVGLNFVAPEDDPVALRDYDLHMRMIAALAKLEPPTNVTLHAGELTLGLVPPHDLTFHIHDAVGIAHARRIGHGVDISYETGAPELLALMRRRNVMVEICLTSNDSILEVRGAAHPLTTYMQAGVPVALATDDEGVSRIDLTHEFERAATEYGFSYTVLKRFARTSLEHAFASGESFWSDFTRAGPVTVCAGLDPAAVPGSACAAFLARNEKARLEWKLEREFAAFEDRAGDFH